VEVFHNTLSVMGFRIDNFCYLTDVKTIAEEEQQKLKDLDVLVLSALRIEPHPNHLNLEEALAMIEKIQPQKAFLTHISHLMGFHDEVSKVLPENVFLAYDTLTVTSN
jgi:phosphoribosyl 1,2-cyclic phosphate phosphodiesterase